VTIKMTINGRNIKSSSAVRVPQKSSFYNVRSGACQWSGHKYDGLSSAEYFDLPKLKEPPMVSDLATFASAWCDQGTARIQPPVRPLQAYSAASPIEGQEVESSASKHYRQATAILCMMSHRLPFLEQPAAISRNWRVPALADVGMSRCAFLDTETTGLSGGAS
jgi:hypothetical protein